LALGAERARRLAVMSEPTASEHRRTARPEERSEREGEPT
jgi:hypothetical protein